MPMHLSRLKRKLSILTGMHLKFKRLSTWNSEDLRTTQILNTFKFDKVLDIGANKGQFSEPLFDYGYTGRIVSFEPTSEAAHVYIPNTAQTRESLHVTETMSWQDSVSRMIRLARTA